MQNINIIDYFHHIHHQNNEHMVHHCGGEHRKIDNELDYKIKHCQCGKHQINIEKAIGHDFENNKINFIFTEKCPEGGWHLESGKIYNN